MIEIIIQSEEERSHRIDCNRVSCTFDTLGSKLIQIGRCMENPVLRVYIIYLIGHNIISESVVYSVI